MCGPYPSQFYRTNNPGLLHATLILSGSLENKLAKKLVLASISTCPDILLPFLKQVSITLDLKPVSKWLIGTQFLNEVCTHATSREIPSEGKGRTEELYSVSAWYCLCVLHKSLLLLTSLLILPLSCMISYLLFVSLWALDHHALLTWTLL